MLRHIPTDLPIFGALAGALGFLAFGFTDMFVELTFGRPSSTAALGIVFIPIWSLLFGLLGLVVGTVVRYVWKRTWPESTDRTRITRSLRVSLVTIVAGASLCGAAGVLIYEIQSRPARLIDTGIVSYTLASDSNTPVRRATQVFGGDTASEAIPWGRNNSALALNELGVQLTDRGRHVFAVLVATGLDYITYVHVAPIFLGGKPEPFLVVIVAGRATARRALVSMLSPDYEIVFQQRVTRFWELEESPLEIRVDPLHGAELAVVGPNCAQSFVLRSK